MLKTAGSKATIDLIEFLQKENIKRDKDYVPEPYHKLNKSYLRKVWDFINPFYRPAKLKSRPGR